MSSCSLISKHQALGLVKIDLFVSEIIKILLTVYYLTIYFRYTIPIITNGKKEERDENEEKSKLLKDDDEDDDDGPTLPVIRQILQIVLKDNLFTVHSYIQGKTFVGKIDKFL